MAVFDLLKSFSAFFKHHPFVLMQVESGITRMMNYMENKGFEIKIKPSDLSREEKRKLLWETWDLLLSKNNSSNKPKIKCRQKKN